jgi:hypothetical protein
MFEWAVIRASSGEVHRGPWADESDARKWLEEAESKAIGIPPGRFYVARRPLGEWERQ